MFFGYQVHDAVIFDLRYIPLIIATVAYSEPLILIVIGAGIGLSRLTFGVNEAAIAGTLNLVILGFVAAALSYWMRHKSFGLLKQGLISILVINIFNSINITLLGVIPYRIYIFDIMPVTLPLSLVLSLIFSLILRDFQLERNRLVQIKYSNVLLSAQADELHKAKMVLEERARDLMLSSQYKTDFLANMSHELRTPLNGIINFAQLISEHDSTRTKEELIEYGDIIYQSGQDLLTIINDILDLSKVEAGKLEIVNEEMNISEIPQIAFMHFEMTSKKDAVEFEVKMDEHLPLTFYTDPVRVQQILRNLLSNAFKFTHSGKVTLDIRTEDGPDPGDLQEWIIFSVKDTGIGISESQQQSIFEAFQQADGSINRKYGGTGLGLSISRDLSRLLGGFIRLESELGVGSCFKLYLPLSQEDA
ncbi:sensor histidine kinase/response regulator [Paenibacillus pini JCM 16418]|uniref:Circadian input-output histidine kinase CikA n=2 Tax=Paenibacillus TaxID=44249 RepID=W7YPD2_9BACL|nr:sensor histidine kinase/response regulator [Paenibacillus pini JCM 16418]